MQSETSAPAVPWKIPFETKNNIADFPGDVFLCLVSAMTWKLKKIQTLDLIKDSIFCKKNSIILTAEEVRKALPATKVELGETNLIVVIPEDYKSFKLEFITEIGDFAGFLQIADMYDLNFDFIVGHPNFIIWFAILREEIKTTYKVNSLIFTSEFDRKIIDKLDIHKTVPNGNPNKSNYPTNAANKKYLSISVKSMPANPKEEREHLSMVLSFLAKNKSDKVNLFASELISTLLYSMKYYDLVVNAEVYKLAEASCPNFYLYFKYALRLMYLEERGTYIATKKTDRFILSSKLLNMIKPQAQTDQVLDHPFIPVCFVNQTPIKTFDLSYYLDYKLRGIHGLDQVKNRINIFSFGALANWTPVQTCSNGQAVTSAINGSIITATCILNPLEASFKYIEDYFEKFYPSRKLASQITDIIKAKLNKTSEPKKKLNAANSTLLYQAESDSDEDINDLLVDALDTMSSQNKQNQNSNKLQTGIVPVGYKKFTGARKSRLYGKVRSLRKTVNPSSLDDILKSDSSDSSDDDKSEDKSADKNGKSEETTEDKTSDKTEEKPEDPYKGTADIDIMVETTDMNLFDEVAAMHFENFKKSRPEVLITLDRVQTENKYKYTIRGLERQIDIFSVNSIPGVIAKFHLGCVRAWFSDDLYAFPSFVSAALTGLNVDVRWVSCNKDLRDILIKYWSRGFGTILSLSNKNCLAEYLATTKYKDVFPKLNSGNSWRDRRRYNQILRSAVGNDKPHIVFDCHVGNSCKYKRPNELRYQKNKVYSCTKETAEWKNPSTF